MSVRTLTAEQEATLRAVPRLSGRLGPRSRQHPDDYRAHFVDLDQRRGTGGSTAKDVLKLGGTRQEGESLLYEVSQWDNWAGRPRTVGQQPTPASVATAEKTVPTFEDWITSTKGDRKTDKRRTSNGRQGTDEVIDRQYDAMQADDDLEDDREVEYKHALVHPSEKATAAFIFMSRRLRGLPTWPIRIVGNDPGFEADCRTFCIPLEVVA